MKEQKVMEDIHNISEGVDTKLLQEIAKGIRDILTGKVKEV